jgi:hypothetical protein
MRRFLKYTGLTLAVLVVLGFTVVAWLLYDGEWLRKETSSRVSELLGRPFVIDSPLDIDVSLHPTIVAEQIKLAGAPWQKGEDLLRVNSLSVTFDLLSLFSERFIIHSIETAGVSLDLVSNEENEVNWDLFPPGDEKVEQAEQGKSLPFELDRFSLKNFRMSHSAPDRTEPLGVHLFELLSAKTESGQVKQSAHGTIGGLPFKSEGLLGPLSHLATGGNFEINAGFSLGDIEYRVQGNVDEVQSMQGIDLELSFSGPDFAWITRELALPEFSSGAFDFELAINTEAAMTRIDLLGDLGSLNIDAQGALDDLSDPKDGRLQIDVTGPDLKPLGELWGEENLPAGHDQWPVGQMARISRYRCRCCIQWPGNKAVGPAVTIVRIIRSSFRNDGKCDPPGQR